jgi:hypothetical protein
MTAALLLLLFGRGAPTLPQGLTSVRNVDRLSADTSDLLSVEQDSHHLTVEEV